MQQEVGEETGTPHLQGCVRLQHRGRPTCLKLPKAIHWEVCRNWDESVRYCSKNDTRVAGTVPWVHRVILERELRVIDPSRPWQLELLAIVKEDPDDRTIHWYWDKVGNVGKSSMKKYLMHEYMAVPIKGKPHDVLYAVAEHRSHIYIYDMPRHHAGKRYVAPYDCLEEVKDMGFLCGKYESKPVLRNPPHVIVFANTPPDWSEMSTDRWRVREILPDYTCVDTPPPEALASLAGDT